MEARAGSEAQARSLFRDEGLPPLHAVERRRNLAERRVAALAAAIRDHQAVARRRHLAPRGEDLELYRRLRRICGDA